MTEEAEVRQLYRLVREVMSEVGIVGRKVDVALNYNQKQFKHTHRMMDRILLLVQQPRAPNHLGVTRDIASTLSSTTGSLSSTSEDRSLGNEDRRTSCMANAFQRNIEAIIHSILFGMVQDKIVERGLVTTSESIELAELPGDRTKMRVLVTNIMDKKVNAMQTFLELIGEYDQRLKECIQNAFDTSIEDSRSDECTACLIQRRINIQDLSDSLVAQEVISIDLYKNIAHDRSMLTEKLLWQRIFDTISLLPRALGATALERALTDSEGIDSHADIVRHVQRDLARNRKSSYCRCSQNHHEDGTTLPFASYSRQTSDIQTPTNVSEDEASVDSDTSTIPEVLPRSQGSYKPISSRLIHPEVSAGVRERPPIPSGKPKTGIQTIQSSTATQMGARPKLQIGDSHRSQNTFFQPEETPQKLASKTTTKPQPNIDTADETDKLSLVGDKEGLDNPKTNDSVQHPVHSNTSNLTELNPSSEPLGQLSNINPQVLNMEMSDILKTPKTEPGNLTEDDASDDSASSRFLKASSIRQGNDTSKSKWIPPAASSDVREQPPIPSIKPKTGIQVLQSSTSTQMGARPKLQTGDSYRSQNVSFQETQRILSSSQTTTTPQPICETANEPNKLSFDDNREGSSNMKTDHNPVHSNISNVTENNFPNGPLRQTVNSNSRHSSDMRTPTNDAEDETSADSNTSTIPEVLPRSQESYESISKSRIPPEVSAGVHERPPIPSGKPLTGIQTNQSSTTTQMGARPKLQTGDSHRSQNTFLQPEETPQKLASKSTTKPQPICETADETNTLSLVGDKEGLDNPKTNDSVQHPVHSNTSNLTELNPSSEPLGQVSNINPQVLNMETSDILITPKTEPGNLTEDDVSDDSANSRFPMASSIRQGNDTRKRKRIPPDASPAVRERPPIPSGKPKIGIQIIQSSTATQIGARPKLQTGDSHRSQNTFFQPEETPQKLASKTTTKPQPNIDTADKTDKLSLVGDKEGSDNPKTNDCDQHPVLSNTSRLTELNPSSEPLGQGSNINPQVLNMEMSDILITPTTEPVNLTETNQSSTLTQMGARSKLQTGDSYRSQNTLFQENQQKLAYKTNTKPQQIIEPADETNQLSFIGNKEGSDDPKTVDSDSHPEYLNIGNITEQNISRQPQIPSANHTSRHPSDIRISDNLSEDNASRSKLLTGDSQQSQNTLFQETQQKLASKTTIKPQQIIETADETNKLSFVGNKEGSDDPKTVDSDSHPESSNIGNITEQNMSIQPLRPTKATSSLNTTNPESADNNASFTRKVPLTGNINKLSHMANVSGVSTETVESSEGKLRGEEGKSMSVSKLLEAHEQRIKANFNVEPERKTPISNGNKVGNSRRCRSVTEQKGNITSPANMSVKQSSAQKAGPKSAIPSIGKTTERPRPRQSMSPGLARKIRQLNKEEDIPEEDD